MNFILKTLWLVLLGALLIKCTEKRMNSNEKFTEVPKEIIEELPSGSQTPANVDPSYDYVVSATAVGNIGGVSFALLGINQREVDGQKVEHIGMDINKSRIVFAKKGDVVDLNEKTKVEVVRIENATYPQIGKVYFKEVK